MADLFGVDVSYAQGEIDWDTFYGSKDFVILRAGYGQGNIDAQAVRNADACIRLGIPFGLYWFSYAYTTSMASAEGQYAAAFAATHSPTMPIFWDFEYDSERVAKNAGVTVDQALFLQMLEEFCSAVETEGYQAGCYYNPDYDYRFGITNYLNNFPHRQKWIAKWSTIPPADFDVWQYTVGAAGTVPGISTQIDLDMITDSPTPPTPPGPGPGPDSRKLPIWFYLKKF